MKPERIRGCIVSVALVISIATLGMAILSYWVTVTFRSASLAAPPCTTFTIADGLAEFGTLNLVDPVRTDQSHSWSLVGVMYDESSHHEIAVTLEPRGWLVKRNEPILGDDRQIRLGNLKMTKLNNVKTTTIGVSLWAIFLLAIFYPIVVYLWQPWSRSRRRRDNRCENCSYRLEGLTGTVCPECGTQLPR